MTASFFLEALTSNRLPKFTSVNAFIVSLGGSSADFQRWATPW